MSKNHKKTLKGNFYGFAVIWREDIKVVSDYVGPFVEVEDLLPVSFMSHIWKEITDLSLNVVFVSLKQMKTALQHVFFR